MLEAPILDKDDLDLALEDPDLMPTFEDFECVLTFMTTNPRAGTLMVLMNVNQFLLTFFTQPASLRLVIGAIAACYTRSAISDDTVLWFFKRARKAVILSADRPSLATAKAYYWIFIFAWIMKKYELGFPFLKMAVGLVSVLRLDVDPDYLPDLVGHSEAEKEERRRLFWALCIASWFGR
ncbi:hypothetical protein HDU79_003889 [Rhizoclosmatium sp. JEL0117]|nr:hypothetical protein HDU79_003889 [Rhizoclosmatium sp. JEL0117]